MAILSVGAGKQFTTIAAAVAAARDGDTVAVTAGTYLNDFATTKAKISLVAVGGSVTMLDTKVMASGQALLTVTTDAAINGFVFSGAHSADGTAAGILITGGATVLQDSLVSGNQNGLVARGTAATVLVQGSEFAANGNADGFSHNIAVGAIASLTIQDSYVHDAVGGQEVRSLAAATTIRGSRIEDNGAAALNAIDLPNGGIAVIEDNTIEKGAASLLAAAIQFGGGTVGARNSLAVSGNVFVADRAGAVVLKNQVMQAASLSGNKIFGFAAQATGLAVSSGNTVPGVRPVTAAAGLIGPVAASFGRAGAVVANGTVRTVGAGGTFATLAAAVAVAHDGDTIDVAAGTYVNDTAVLSHKVIIEGVGGMARFVDTTGPANGAQFVTTTDVTLRNVEIFGASTPGGVAAAIHDEGGNLTVVNSTIHDNQAGLVVDKDAAGSVGIYDSEISANGTADGRGGNLQVAEVGTLTLGNDYVHSGLGGAEIVSAADHTMLDGVRVSQAAGNAAAAVVLPNGGDVGITNSAIEKGAIEKGASAGPVVVQVGGGAVYAGSSVKLSADTLISDGAAAGTVFVANAGPSGGVAVSGTTFVGGVASVGGAAGGVQVLNGSNTGAVVGAAGVVNGASPWGAKGAPAAAALLAVAAPAAGPAENGQLILRISEAAWHGDAQFGLTVDGAAVAGILTATAAHGVQSQSFTVAGAYAPGPHTVGVTFLNSLAGPDGGRALFIDGMAFNGQDSGQSVALPADGTALLSTAPTVRATAVVVNVSEDAWHGDALAFISIDGKVQGGVQTVTAAHAAGKSQAMSFLLDLAPGGHTAAVTMLNGASGPGGARDLFVDSMDVAGQHFGNAAAVLGTEGTSSFAFTVAPAGAANGALFVTAGAPTALSLLPPLG